MHIVLVHGMGGSAASWSLVAPLIEQHGVPHSLADNMSQSLTDDVAAVTRLIEDADDEVLLVGHSYGGAVITNAGRHERVRGLVYLAAFAPDEGETVNQIVERYPAADVSRFFTRGPNGEWIPDDSAEARQTLAWDVPDEVWARRHDDRRVSSNEIFRTASGVPAWRHLPAWYLRATQDKHIRPEAQRDMAARAGAVLSDVPSSHAIPHAAPDAAVALILRAADAVRD